MTVAWRFALGACVVLLAGCGGSSTGTIDLHTCTVGPTTTARCGTFRVPENPNRPDGRQIPLDVVVFPATGGQAKPDPVFWFSGWGGAAVEDDAVRGSAWLAWANVDRDLVFVDQRGTGSSKLVCDFGEANTAAGITAGARRCAARLGPNLRYYTSAAAVDDLDRVREALGYEKINLYGGSYGVTTQQVYLLRHGGHVRSAVLDSGSLLDVRIFEREARNAQRALELLFGRCAADASCSAAYPRLRQEYTQVVDRLARGPIPIPGTTRSVDAVTFAYALDSLLGDTYGKTHVPRPIHLIAIGKVAEAMGDAPQAPDETSAPAYMGLIQCSEPWASYRPAVVDRTSKGTFMRPLVLKYATVSNAVCKAFPQGYAPAAIGERVRSDVPVLLLAGNEDPTDPPANLAHAERELPASRTVIFPGSGHGQIPLACAQHLIAEFLDRGSARGLDTTCAESAAVHPFDTSS